jgi:hypothetical protein
MKKLFQKIDELAPAKTLFLLFTGAFLLFVFAGILTNEYVFGVFFIVCAGCISFILGVNSNLLSMFRLIDQKIDDGVAVIVFSNVLIGILTVIAAAIKVCIYDKFSFLTPFGFLIFLTTIAIIPFAIAKMINSEGLKESLSFN